MPACAEPGWAAAVGGVNQVKSHGAGYSESETHTQQKDSKKIPAHIIDLIHKGYLNPKILTYLQLVDHHSGVDWFG